MQQFHDIRRHISMKLRRMLNGAGILQQPIILTSMRKDYIILRYCTLYAGSSN